MRYLTIDYVLTFPNAPSLKRQNVLFATPDGERFYSPEGGPTHFYIDRDKYQIIEEHGEFSVHDETDYAKIERLVISNMKKYHKPTSEISESAGWLSPTGEFFPCKEWEHDGLANTICQALLGYLRGTRYLESMNWIRVYDDGVAAIGDEPTQKQMDTAFDIATIAQDDKYKRNIMYIIRWAARGGAR